MEFKNQCVEQGEVPYNTRYYNYQLIYVPSNKVESNRNFGWEHGAIHEDALEDPARYYSEIPPVITDEDFCFKDGHHRVNFCRRFNVPVPCAVRAAKPNTHKHLYVDEFGQGRSTLVFDHECEEHKKTHSRVTCLKH